MMNRTERLLDLLQVLRRHRLPVSGQILAQAVGISIRTLYRDIATLQAQGADIRGEPGVGYLLRPGFMLPPLMFSPDELEALVVGFKWTSIYADRQMAEAASDALAKISAVLPDNLRYELENTTLLVGPRIVEDVEAISYQAMRSSIRQQTKAEIEYRSPAGKTSVRTIWPFALGFFPHTRVLVAWCEQQNDFRHFTTANITRFQPSGVRYPRQRALLLKAWRAQGLDTRTQP